MAQQSVSKKSMTKERKNEILVLVDRYNRTRVGNETPLSPFIAEHQGRLGEVSERIDVPEDELRKFLDIMNRELPWDY